MADFFMAATKEFYLKAIVTAQDRLSPALKNIVKQAETVRASFGKFNRMSEAALFGFMDRLPAASKQFTLLRGEMAKVGSRFFALGKEVAAAGAGFVGVGGGIMRLVSDATAAGDALQKMSIRTGMSAEAIQQWQFVADRSGITVETMNKCSSNVQVYCITGTEQYSGINNATMVARDKSKELVHIAKRHGKEVIPGILEAVIDGKVARYVQTKRTIHLQKDGCEAVLSLDEHGKKKPGC